MEKGEAAGVWFVIGWGIAGLLGLVPWNHPSWFGETSQGWVWHMNQDNAWFIWALCATLVGIVCSAIAYAVQA